MYTDHDVVVTGIGATTPIGGTAPDTWRAMLEGRNGVTTNDAPWVEKYQLPVKIHAPLAVEPTEILTRVEARRLDRAQQVALVAAREAWADAGEPGVDPERLAAVVGTGIGGALTLLGQDDILENDGLRKVAVLTIPMLMPNGPAAAVGLWVKARGGVHAPVSACASGAEAIAWAYRLIKSGEVDVAIAGGAEAVTHQLPVAGFAQMRAMSTRNDDPEHASRPFDLDRDGFVLGEGAGIMVLERADFAKARGARIYGRLAGIGMSNDAYHITAPEPDGEGSARAIGKALRMADLTPMDIGHVNAHATSTPVGDIAESKTILRAIGDHPVVTSTKSMTGHMLGASGAVEAIATMLAVRDGIVPGTRNIVNLDPEIKVDVATENREVKLTAAINDSFGFGGHNVALVFTAD
ncbi:beta-ketoacyl-[acyl-carrier-protein] synthase family protein [Nakamurella flavida]|uniref:Beta-ketoacyl-[acyl-carrier-protein] synthase family protein n=1 Tax=Nakamurella flavida TaxID=363630 RepID=A0A938YL29_9ACTN|nr:beta-ketoacyl-[acyl-carrier-protein] synthase family protein [Nakamurella flavida]MBM9474895.1 beta-ketoacyl-[acyl-carrier-protein] synthase family protein [Nakamurella flavida]MDP9776464.1 3-oxoacyl-[acyl-carrier-protein] synthase II [Nakamurella flavida]